MGKKVLVAMSGGVDSSVTADILKKQGYEIIGATMKLFDESDVSDAEDMGRTLHIPHHTLDLRQDFRDEIIERFISEYESGRTPNPCVDCNRRMKFGRLLELAEDEGCEYMATGHYARIEKDGDRYLLKKAADISKDQSYVLYMLTQEQLAHILFPLGDMSKEETRDLARDADLFNADKKDSQDICFVPGGDYISVIHEMTGKEYPKGEFRDKNGEYLGEHSGIINYTLGQRKGLGIALGRPAYVCGIDADTNTVILGDNEDLFKREFEVYNTNYILWEEPPSEIRCRVKVRYNQKEQPAVIYPGNDGTARIVFDEPQRAITPGQAAVFYDGDIVLGGGTVE